jgi:uroporphyrinogen III methyltransferase/synthase
MKKPGFAYLVGAGPGDAGLLTLRGAELLARADVVLYDALVNPQLLSRAPASAEIIFGGKRGGGDKIPQEELNAILVDRARAGKIVVRLKGGDPYVFGRGGEEAEVLNKAKIPFEVVPGVSSFVAAPNYAGIPLTHRNFASRITLITGHDDPEPDNKSIDWAHLARTPGTKVIMMGTDRVSQIARTLVEHGMPATTPVGMVQWGTTSRQRSIAGMLANIGELAATSKIGPPTIMVVGEVVSLRAQLNWFEHRPLFGQRVVVTRSRDQASQLSDRLRDLGAETLEIPTIKLEHPTDRQHLVDALLELNSYDWLVFTSPNGVTRFFEYFFKQFHDMRDLGGARIAAVGPGTAARLKEYHLQVDLMPEEALGIKVAAAFQKFETIENLKICLLRAEVANPDLPQALEALGAIVDDVACYRTVPETEDVSGTAARLVQVGADWITFTSGSTVENFHARFDLPKLVQQYPTMRLASIGPETSNTLIELGLKASVEAKEHTIEGLVKAVMGKQVA